MDLVKWKPDPVVIGICKTWAGAYDSTEVLTYGFQQDDTKTGFADAVGDFKDLLASQKK